MGKTDRSRVEAGTNGKPIGEADDFTAFHHLYNDTPAMLHSIDRNGRLVSVSNYWLEVLGYERREVIGRKSTEFLTEASRRYAEEVILPEYFRTGFCRDVSYQVVTKSGGIVDVLLSATAERDDSGEIIRSLAVMTDVTEHKRAEEALRESEERYRKIVETSRDGIMVLDAAARVTYVNRQMAEMFGESGADMLGRSFLDFVDDSVRSEVAARLERRKTGVREQYETIFSRKDGEKMWGSVSATPIMGADGAFLGSFGMISDVSERKLAAARIEVLNTDLAARASELEMLNEELEAFGSMVSHDLRKPLTAINGYSELILEMFGASLDPQCRSYLQEVVNGAVRMNQLIDTLLNFSRRTRSELHRETVDLSAMAHDVMAELRLADPARRVACRIAEGVVVNGDVRLLRVVLDNLLGNAWKYTAKNRKALIEFGAVEFRGKPACFVRDNGVGFDMAQANRLFSAFQRLHSADEFEGTGIGLATVHRIIQRHGGRVWAEGKAGKGATFYFTTG